MKNQRRFPVIALAAWLVPVAAGAQTADAPNSALPVRAVSVFTSGVSYIERSGQVDGDATVPLSFRTAQINDILKSLVLLDEHGQVQPVTYGAHDPISRTLQSFAVDVTQPMTRAALLNSLRGSSVTVTTNANQTLTGQIVGVEDKTVASGEKTYTVQALNLLTADGLQSVYLDDARTIKLLDARTDKEFREALTTLAAGADDQRRTVTLRFAGQGKRGVTVGYVTESPLWKISYRLLLGGAKGAASKPYLQGWAMVENTTDDDWQNIHLSLVSGRPVSFIEDLYQSLYLPRPVVAPDIIASPNPQTHGDDLQVEGTQQILEPAPAVPAPTATTGVVTGTVTDQSGTPVANASVFLIGTGEMTHTYSNGTYFFAGVDPATYTVRVEMAGFQIVTAPITITPNITSILDFSLQSRTLTSSATRITGTSVPRNLEQQVKSQPNNVYQFPGLVFGQPNDSVTAQAQGADAGEQYEYDITTPITLPRQQAAMIPVVAQEIDGDKVLLYNADSDPKFPLDAVRLHNTTTLHLKGGPVTLFDDGVYAGDARMEDVLPGATRLISYAVDLSVQGDRQQNYSGGSEMALSIKRGVLSVTIRERQETDYTLKSLAKETKTVLVEHPYDAQYTLITPEKADERTADFYRFAVSLAPGESKTLKVIAERPLINQYGLVDTDLTQIAVYAGRADLSEPTRAALHDVITRRRAIDDLNSQASERDSELSSIGTEQERIRKNMGALDHSSVLYKRYVGELNDQETRIQTLRTQSQKLKAQAADADRDLRAYLDTLTLTP